MKYIFMLLVIFSILWTTLLIYRTKYPTFKTTKDICVVNGGTYSTFRIPEGFGNMCTFTNDKLPIKNGAIK